MSFPFHTRVYAGAATTPSDKDNIPVCRLLALPAELRNVIYELLLTSPLLATLRRAISLNHFSSYVLPPLPLTPAVLSTCRQIYTEASPILYTRNTFTASPTLLTSMPYLVHPSKPICSATANRRITHWYINIRLDCDPRFTEADVTAAFTGAKELEVEATQAMFRASDNGVLLLFQGVRGVGKAVVHGSVERGLAEYIETCMMSPIGSVIEPFDDALMREYCKWAIWSR